MIKEPKEFDYFKAWLLFFLVATVGGGVIGMIIGSFVAAFLGAGGMSLPQMTRVLRSSVSLSPFRFLTSLFGVS
ncbi:MAG TPA: hypothetical protein VGI60_04425 [Chthoniobacterales bacterium]|jgi:hypothetical protein